jgi:transposase
MQSQKICEYLTFLGKEVNLELFFKNYIHLIYGPNTGCGIVIDSTGATNLNIDLAKLNNHNGVINNEIRLMYVIDREKKVPIYYRVIADNIIDVTTLQNTINELKALNIDVKYSVLDAGYYSEDNINFLYSNNINFLTRMVPSHVIAKDLISKHFDEVNHAKNLVRHNNRFLFVKKIPFKLFDYKAFAYISIDYTRQFNECETLFKNTYGTKNFNPDQIELERKTLATFILLSSIDLDIFEVIPYYSSRNYIEQIFDVEKIDTLLLPLRVHSIEALMGYILINFLTEISYFAINQEFINTTYGAKNALYELSCLYSKVLNNQIHTYEPNEKMKELLKILKIDIPKVLYLPT